MPVDTSVYQNQPNPLGQLTGVFGIMNANQQLQLGQQAQQIRQYELQQGQADDLRTTIGSLVNQPGITRAQVLSTAAQRARQINAVPGVYDAAIAPFNDPNADVSGILKSYGMQASGVPGITARTNVVNPQSGAPASTSSTGAIGATLPTGLPVGAEQSTQQMYGDLAVAKNYSTNIVPWMKAREALAQLPEGATGPTTEGKQYVESALWSLAPQVAKWAGVAPDQITNYGTLQKYLAQAANQLGGNGTDLKIMQTITGNPNVHMNDLTNRQLINFGIAVQRMGAAQSLEASRADPNAPVGSNPVGYAGKAGTLGPTMDPRAFEVDLLPPDQRKKLLDSIKSPADRAKFNYSYHIGLKNQLFAAPGQ